MGRRKVSLVPLILVILFLGGMFIYKHFKGVPKQQPNARRETQQEQEDRSEPRYARGEKDVISGTFERNPIYPNYSKHEYVVVFESNSIPIDKRDGEKYLGKNVRVYIQYTGNGEEFDIMRTEIIE